MSGLVLMENAGRGAVDVLSGASRKPIAAAGCRGSQSAAARGITPVMGSSWPGTLTCKGVLRFTCFVWADGRSEVDGRRAAPIFISCDRLVRRRNCLAIATMPARLARRARSRQGGLDRRRPGGHQRAAWRARPARWTRSSISISTPRQQAASWQSICPAGLDLRYRARPPCTQFGRRRHARSSP